MSSLRTCALICLPESPKSVFPLTYRVNFYAATSVPSLPLLPRLTTSLLHFTERRITYGLISLPESSQSLSYHTTSFPPLLLSLSLLLTSLLLHSSLLHYADRRITYIFISSPESPKCLPSHTTPSPPLLLSLPYPYFSSNLPYFSSSLYGERDYLKVNMLTCVSLNLPSHTSLLPSLIPFLPYFSTSLYRLPEA